MYLELSRSVTISTASFASRARALRMGGGVQVVREDAIVPGKWLAADAEGSLVDVCDSRRAEGRPFVTTGPRRAGAAAERGAREAVLTAREARVRSSGAATTFAPPPPPAAAMPDCSPIPYTAAAAAATRCCSNDGGRYGSVKVWLTKKHNQTPP